MKNNEWRVHEQLMRRVEIIRPWMSNRFLSFFLLRLYNQIKHLLCSTNSKTFSHPCLDSCAVVQKPPSPPGIVKLFWLQEMQRMTKSTHFTKNCNALNVDSSNLFSAFHEWRVGGMGIRRHGRGIHYSQSWMNGIMYPRHGAEETKQPKRGKGRGKARQHLLAKQSRAPLNEMLL